jgi:hypothetical protein
VVKRSDHQFAVLAGGRRRDDDRLQHTAETYYLSEQNITVVNIGN